MALQIVINQAGKPAGVAGQAREDLDLGVPVTLSTSGGPFAQYRWSIISKPVDLITTLARSAAGLATPTSSTTQFTPIDLEGTYLLELAVDSGAGLGAKDTDVARISFYAGPLLAAEPWMYPRREPAFGERTEHNVPDVIDPSGNPEGWAREKLRQYLVQKDLWIGRLWAGGTVVGHPFPLASFQRVYRCSNVVWNFGTSMYDITFDTPLPDGAYSVFITPQGSAGANGFVAYRTEALGPSGFSVAFTDDLSTGVLVTAAFSFRVELGVTL